MVLGGSLTVFLGQYLHYFPLPVLPWETWAAGAGFLCLGALDDRCSFQPKYKFYVMLLLAALASLPWIATIHHSGPMFLTSWVAMGPLALLLTFWFMAVPNAVNIEDAINGYMGGFTFIVLLTLQLKGLALGIPLGALAGFLVLNWPRARHFMGDTGSYVCGFFIAEALLRAGALYHPVLALALTAPISLDVAMGLVRRHRLGMRFMSPDRSTCPHHVLALAKGSPLLATPFLWSIAAGFALSSTHLAMAGVLALTYLGLLVYLNRDYLFHPNQPRMTPG